MSDRRHGGTPESSSTPERSGPGDVPLCLGLPVAKQMEMLIFIIFENDEPDKGSIYPAWGLQGAHARGLRRRSSPTTRQMAMLRAPTNQRPAV